MDKNVSWGQLMCGICGEIFRKPVTLQCGHTYCRGCVKAVKGLTHKVLSFKCESCSKITRLKKGKNLILNELVNSLCQKAKLDCNKCSNCESSISQLKPCKDCIRPLCQNCEITHDCPAQKLKCPEHGKSYKLFCKECRDLCCGKCMLDEEKHHNHNFEALLSTFRRTYRVLDSDLNELRDKMKDTIAVWEDAAINIGKLYVEAEENLYELRVEVNQCIDRAGEELEAVRNQRVEEIRTNLERLDKLNIGAVVEYFENLLEKAVADAAKAYKECLEVGNVCKQIGEETQDKRFSDNPPEMVKLATDDIRNVFVKANSDLAERLATSLALFKEGEIRSLEGSGQETQPEEPEIQGAGSEVGPIAIGMKYPLLKGDYRKHILTFKLDKDVTISEIKKLDCKELGITEVGGIDYDHGTLAILDKGVNRLLVFSVDEEGNGELLGCAELPVENCVTKFPSSLKGVKVEEKNIYAWSSCCFWAISKKSVKAIHYQCMGHFNQDFTIVGMYETCGIIEVAYRQRNIFYRCYSENFKFLGTSSLSRDGQTLSVSKW